MAEAAQGGSLTLGLPTFNSVLPFVLMLLSPCLCLQLSLYFFPDSHNRVLGTYQSVWDTPTHLFILPKCRLAQEHTASVGISRYYSVGLSFFGILAIQ